MVYVTTIIAVGIYNILHVQSLISHIEIHLNIVIIALVKEFESVVYHGYK